MRRHFSRLDSGCRVVAFAALFGLSSCAHEMGQNAVSGMTSKLAANQAATQDDPSKQILRVSSERVVAGAVSALDAPEQRAMIRQVVSDAVNAAVMSAFRAATAVGPDREVTGVEPGGKRLRADGPEGVSPVAQLMAQAARAAVGDAVAGLVRDLGGNGEGPLAVSLAGTGKNVSAAVVNSALDQLSELFPGCRGPDAVPCIDRQVQKMSRSAATGFTIGLRQTIGWPLLILAGLVGLAIGLLGHWLWSQRSSQGRVLRPRTT